METQRRVITLPDGRDIDRVPVAIWQGDQHRMVPYALLLS
jgi:hypothetical protein